MAPDLFLSEPLVTFGHDRKGTILKKRESGFSGFACAFFLIILGSMFTNRASAQTASFTADDTAGCAPMSVNFTNTSSPGVTGYAWDLGNSEVSYFADAFGIYGTAGTYTVTLVEHYGTTTVTATKVIHVYAAPTVHFTASDTAICPYESTTFTSTSIPGAPGTLTYNWNFGDGYTSAAPSPSHAYPSPGYYSATLFLTNGEGCYNSLTKSSYIHVTNPAAISFNAPATFFCKAPAHATFINTTTGTFPLSYSWNFGDGGTSLSASPAHTYTAPGTYSVRLIATDGKGCKDTLTLPAYITVGNLTAAFTSPAIACGVTPVTFTNTSSTHISSQWFFGDGGTSTSDIGVHSYTAPGVFTVKLVVFDGTCYDTVTHPITISYPTGGTFNILPAAPCPPPDLLTFAGTGPAGTTISWIFNDGSTAPGATVTHTYATPSIYSTSMVVTNGSGCKDTVTKLDTLYNLNINPTASVGDGCLPLTNSFSVYAYSEFTDPFTLAPLFLSYPFPIGTYTWNWSDGSPNSTGPTPSHTYTAVGSYTVTCTVVTTNGCTASNKVFIKAGTKQTASFTRTPTNICTHHTISFHSTSTSTLLIDNYTWSFGDGGAAAGLAQTSPVHIYSTPGIYNANLVVSYNGCLSDNFILADTVDSPGAVIHYNFDCNPANGITFLDTSVGETSHLWMFGDGATSTLHSIDHHYPSLTLFTASLATYNSTSGCRDTAYAALNLAKAIIGFSVFDTALCKGQSDTITSSVFVRTSSNNMWYDNGVLKGGTGSLLTDTFNTAGLHNIVLVITDNYGCSDTSATFHILAASPNDSFSFTPPTGCGPLAVNFTDHSTDVGGAVFTTYAWTFGDGTTSVSSTPTVAHIYSLSGSYPVQEIVTDNAGCADTFINATHVTVHKPVAVFSVTATSVCAGVNIHFINSSTGITGSKWFFGDGLTSTATSPLHAYSAPGVYTVKLVVFDAFGCASDTLTMPGLITVNFSPAASFTMSDSFAVCPPLNVDFTNTSTGAVSYYWMFGDTSYSNDTSPSKVYIYSHSYQVNLVATASNGCTDTATHNVSLFGYAGAFSYTPLSGCSPLKVHFAALVASVDSFFWDFSDGSGFAGVLADTLSHNYLSAGNYLPKLILKDSFGCTTFSFGSDTIRVDTVAPAFSITPNPACQYAPITLHDLSGSGSFFPMTGWLWSFGSGATSTLSNPSYTYSVSGTHSVTLMVTDSSGCSGTVTHTVTVNAAPPAISGPSIVCLGAVDLFTDGLSPGAWSSSNPGVASVGTGTGFVTGVTNGTATITYTSGPGCPAIKLVTVSPSPSAIAGINSMCVTLSSSYSDTIPGGTWSIAPLTVATVSPTGTVTGILPGVATLTYTLGLCSATKTITITPAPSPIVGPATVCVGNSVTLTDLIPGGSWISTSSNVVLGTGFGQVTGASAGTAIITYSLGVGCTKTTTLTVNALSPIVGPTGVCVTGIIALTDATTGGSWSSSPSSIASVGTSGSVTGLLAGTATIFYTLPTGCTATHVVTVHGLPSPIIGSLHVCQFATDTLSDTASGGLWSISPTTTAGTIDPLSGVLTGLLTATATVTYSLGSTGCQRIAVITVDAAPSVITGPSIVCQGSSTTLSDATVPGTWSSGSTAASVGSGTGVVAGLSPGVAPIIFTAASNGCTRTHNVTVNPLPSPITGPATLCIGVSATLTDTMAGLIWSTSSGAIGTVVPSTGVITGVSAGPVTFTGMNTVTGCVATKTVTITSTPADIAGSSTVCVGSTTTLTDASAGGSWLASNGFATIGTSSGLVTGIVPGIDTITYSIGIGCVVNTIMTVTALPGPVAGPNNVCVGSSITLTDPSGTGTWSSSNPFVSIVNPSTGSVTGVSAGSNYITYSLGVGCNAAMLVTVKPVPGGISGATYVCLGGTTTLTDLTPSGAWSSTNSFVAPISSTGVVTGANGGSSIISYTASNGCAAIHTMSVIAVPAITGLGSVPICAWHDTINVNDAAPGGIYTSYLVTALTIGGGNGWVVTHAPGVAVVTYVLPSGCSTTSSFTVNPLPDIITGSLHACIGVASTLSDATPGGFWSSPGYSSVLIINPSSGLLTGMSSGTAMVTYTLSSTSCYVDTTVTVGPQPAAISGPSTLCPGASMTLTDPSGGGVWTSTQPAVASVTALTGNVSGGSAGVDTINYTLGYCTAVKPITVNPLPTVYPVTGGGSYCAGGTGVSVGLFGSQPGVNYQLFNGIAPMGATIAGTGGIINFGPQTVAGIYTVVATSAITSCSTAMTGSVVITINPLPTSYALTGGNYCAGTSGTPIGLAGSSAGSTYTLYFAGAPASAAVTGTGSPISFGTYAATGVYQVFATNTATTCTGFMAASLTVGITPTVTPAVSISLLPGDTVCAGTPVSFTASAVNGGTSPAYQWKVNGTGGAAGASYTYSPANGDVVSAKLTSNAICPLPDTAMASVTMNVDALVVPTVTIAAIPGTTIARGQAVTLIAGFTNGGPSPTFQWYKNGVLIPGATSDTLAVTNVANNDSFSCVVTSSGLCGGQPGSHSSVITVNTTGVIQLGIAGDITVVPNPNKGEFTVKGSLGSTLDEEVTLEITDMLGQVVYKTNVTAHNGILNERVHPDNNLANGVYLLNLHSESASKIFHIVIER